MPTAKPRLSVTLEPGLYDTISEIARIRGVSRSSVIAEYLDTAAPVLQRTLTILRALDARLKAARSGLDADMSQYRAHLEDAEKTLAPMLASALGTLEGLEPPPSNTGVTPPSSVDSTERPTGSKAPSGAASSEDQGHDV